MKETMIANVSKDSHPDEQSECGGKPTRGLPKVPVNPPRGVSYVEKPNAVIQAIHQARMPPRRGAAPPDGFDPPEGIGRGTVRSGGVKMR